MWIMTTTGYYSIVEKPWDTEEHALTVRARMRDDIDAAYNAIPAEERIGEIEEDDRSDYRFRFRAYRIAVANWMLSNVLDIKNDNFKNEVKQTQGADRAAVYGRCWNELYDMQWRDSQRLGRIFDGDDYTVTDYIEDEEQIAKTIYAPNYVIEPLGGDDK